MYKITIEVRTEKLFGTKKKMQIEVPENSTVGDIMPAEIWNKKDALHLNPYHEIEGKYIPRGWYGGIIEGDVIIIDQINLTRDLGNHLYFEYNDGKEPFSVEEIVRIKAYEIANNKQLIKTSLSKLEMLAIVESFQNKNKDYFNELVEKVNRLEIDSSFLYGLKKI